MDLSKSLDFFNPLKYNYRIHIVGCGSVGATLAENLARLGLTKFTLWDFDTVESKNIANQIFVHDDIGKSKVDATERIITEINPLAEGDIIKKSDGWNGETLSGFVFLAVDNIEIRKRIVKMHKLNPNVKAVFDFRTGLYDAQHYAARWNNPQDKTDLYNSMDFTNEESDIATPMSACHTLLSVNPTIRIICGYGVANFINFWNEEEFKKVILINAFRPEVIAF